MLQGVLIHHGSPSDQAFSLGDSVVAAALTGFSGWGGFIFIRIVTARRGQGAARRKGSPGLSSRGVVSGHKDRQAWMKLQGSPAPPSAKVQKWQGRADLGRTA